MGKKNNRMNANGFGGDREHKRDNFRRTATVHRTDMDGRICGGHLLAVIQTITNDDIF